MLDIILGLLTGAKAQIYAFVAALVPALMAGVYWLGRRDAAKKQAAKELRKRLDDLKEAKEIEDEVRGLDDNALRNRASKWVREAD